ncbi:MAG TPA: TlpA disulfide reductase family protein [Pyrinomonadaceae bacterium]|jgi:thiol-disulfide isomerase/thioredoxin
MKTIFLNALMIAVVLAAAVAIVSAQKPAAAGPTITKIDLDGLKTLLKPTGKPRLINFWATWCDPCREEFPELVKIDAAYRGKIDFVTVSLDDLDDIETTVPKFLTQMKATMPAYLLNASDEDAAIAAIAGISSDFQGNLPFTILIKPNGELAYSRAGKIRPDILNTEITKELSAGK